MTEKTKSVSARLPLETIEEMEKKLKNQGIALRELLTVYANDGVNTIGNRDKQVEDNGTNVNTFEGVSEEVVKDIKSMIHLWGMSEKKFFSELDEALNDGRVNVEGGKVVGHESLDLTKFYEKCRDMNAKPQEVIDKIVRSMG